MAYTHINVGIRRKMGYSKKRMRFQQNERYRTRTLKGSRGSKENQFSNKNERERMCIYVRIVYVLCIHIIRCIPTHQRCHIPFAKYVLE